MSRTPRIVHCIECTEETHWTELAKRIGVDSRQVYRYNPTLWTAYAQGKVESGTVLYVPNDTQAHASTFHLDLPPHASEYIQVYTDTLRHLSALLSLTGGRPIRPGAHTWVPPGTTSRTTENTLVNDTPLLDIVRSPLSDTKALCADMILNTGHIYVKRKCRKTRQTREDPMKLTNISHAKTGALQANGTITQADTCASGGSYAPLKRVFLRRGTRIPQHTNSLHSEQGPSHIQCTFLHPDDARASWHPVVVDQRRYRVYDSLPHRLVVDRSGVLTVVGVHTVCEVTIDKRAHSLSFDTLWEALHHVYVTSDPPLLLPPQEVDTAAPVPRVRVTRPKASRREDNASLSHILAGITQLTADDVQACLASPPQTEGGDDLDDLGDMSFLLASPPSSPTHASNVPSSPNCE